MESTAGRPRTLYPCFSMHAQLPRGSWENNLCQRIGFTGPSDAFTEQGCMLLTRAAAAAQTVEHRVTVEHIIHSRMPQPK